MMPNGKHAHDTSLLMTTSRSRQTAWVQNIVQRLLLICCLTLFALPGCVLSNEVSEDPIDTNIAPTSPTNNKNSLTNSTNAHKSKPDDMQTHYPNDWQTIQQHVDEEKLKQALEHIDRLYQKAQTDKQQQDWARALIRGAELRIRLQSNETAVQTLRQQSWPDKPYYRAIVELFYAHSLQQYLARYSWEINQREKVNTDSSMALKQWTRQDIIDDIHQAYQRVWEQRKTWGDSGLGDLAEYFKQGNYPEHIRGSLRDTVSYLWSAVFANDTYWTTEDSHSVYRLKLDKLLASKQAPINLSDSKVHPLQRLSYILSDLHDWHHHNGQKAAAFEALRQQSALLYDHFTHVEEREQLDRYLTQGMEKLGDSNPWWTMGQWQRTEWQRAKDTPDNFIKARSLAQACIKKHPESIGAQRCQRSLQMIESPEFRLESMGSDGKNKRSLRVKHKNISTLYFRAWKLDLKQRLLSHEHYSIQPRWNDIPDDIMKRPISAQWQAGLPATPDYHEHQSFITPPLKENGLWLIAASEKADFSEENNSIQAVNLVLTDLVLSTQRPTQDVIEITVRQGESGQLLSGVSVDLLSSGANNRMARIEHKRSNQAGQVEFKVPDDGHYIILAESADSLALSDTLSSYGYHNYHPNEQSDNTTPRTLLFTDRAVYRPGQKILWKAIVYNGNHKTGELGTLANIRGRIKLLDMNGQIVEDQSIKTNRYGSASGAFTAKSEHLRGTWRIQTEWHGQKVIRVEEYKRPTFKVTLNEPENALRLNQQAQLKGTAHYYFGQAVSDASVAWRVTRTPIYPSWRWWVPRSYYMGSNLKSEVIAKGDSPLNAEGEFVVDFMPSADERNADKQLSYRFKLEVDITDKGGETRNASRSFRLGFVAVNATIESDRNFYAADESITLETLRKDLDDTPRAGQARWRLNRVLQPDAVMMPADHPILLDDAARAYATQGDRQQPRWHRAANSEQQMEDWPDSKALNSGTLTHNEEGKARLQLGNLAPGLYRLHYDTEDQWGAPFTMSYPLFVTSQQGYARFQFPAILKAEKERLEVGETARLLVGSGFKNVPVRIELFKHGERIDEQYHSGLKLLDLPIKEGMQGGFTVRLSAVRDYQVLQQELDIHVPWTDRKLNVTFSSFRDQLTPGSKERWSVTVKDSEQRPLEKDAAEVLAYMYDRSLDVIAKHQVPDVMRLYPSHYGSSQQQFSLSNAGASWRHYNRPAMGEYPNLKPHQLKYFSLYDRGRSYSVGSRDIGFAAAPALAPMAKPSPKAMADVAMPTLEMAMSNPKREKLFSEESAEPEPDSDPDVRKNFAETAFFYPHLTLEKDGSVSFEFDVPDSATEWKIWAHAISNDLRGGSAEQTATSAKELLVRPYLPRFLRQGDRAEIQVVVNNNSKAYVSGELQLDVFDPKTGANLNDRFSLTGHESLNFKLAAGKSQAINFPLVAPNYLGNIAFRAKAKTAHYSDGEQRVISVLPSRIHLTQSRFTTLKGEDQKQLYFEDLAQQKDPTRIDEKLVVNIEAQLFYSVLNALPYLVDYPYECTEQTLNRFLSTSIIHAVFKDHPTVADMASKLSERTTQFEQWNNTDANRRMLLEETPWLHEAHGIRETPNPLLRVLDPVVAEQQQLLALDKLNKAQLASGGFPWWPGGPASPYMTMYLQHGFARAIEFGLDIPKAVVQNAWRYLHQHYTQELLKQIENKDSACCWEGISFLSYILSAYPDESWTAGVFNRKERQQMLDFSFKHWKQHSPLLKSYLALSLHRAGRNADARLVFDSLMDASTTDEQLGTYWAPEDRAWLWYNDTVDQHAFSLRTLMEINPQDPRREGLVQWLMLDKKLNHWKSTRATAEAIYALTHYLKQENQLGVEENVTIKIGNQFEQPLIFNPSEYTGRKNQIVLENQPFTPDMATIKLSKTSPGLMFASANWHFSTENWPQQGDGDFFSINRQFFKRAHNGNEWVLQPLEADDKLKVGDQLEVHLSLRSKHEAEYVHLRSPRAAGLEPENNKSAYRWDTGLGYYEEIRDNGSNFFFERLPAGEYTFKLKLRAATAGTFKVAPAQIQSMYAPEFGAYSGGTQLHIEK